MTGKIHAVFTFTFSIVVLVAVCWGIALVGSPGKARQQRLDQRRLEDLQTIYREIQFLCRDPNSKNKLKQPLPQSLEELALLARKEKIKITDPETGQRYEFKLINTNEYELCATFSTERDSDMNVFWNHPVGRHCFRFNVFDPPFDAK